MASDGRDYIYITQKRRKGRDEIQSSDFLVTQTELLLQQQEQEMRP